MRLIQASGCLGTGPRQGSLSVARLPARAKHALLIAGLETPGDIVVATKTPTTVPKQRLEAGRKDGGRDREQERCE
jgi:hypothetical protein